MLVEGFVVYKNLKNREKFSEEKKDFTLLKIIDNILTIIFIIITLFLWVRFVVFAFDCSNAQGLCALFFTSHFIFYKFTNMMKTYCRNKLNK
tara:strand:+ start:447 stop:722 length:276 start_codon:yes stop_codon:yes gene_type:complete